ncbi:hypothetical protein BRC2024_ULFKEANI_CDS_0054 [Acinetobacter phage vB_AbaM_Konradin-v2]
MRVAMMFSFKVEYKNIYSAVFERFSIIAEINAKIIEMKINFKDVNPKALISALVMNIPNTAVVNAITMPTKKIQ